MCTTSEFYRECQTNQINESGTRLGNWFLQPWKSIFTTVEIDFFYHRGKLVFYNLGNWFLPPRKWTFFTTLEIDFTTIENT